MAYRFSARSQDALDECDVRLQRVLAKAIEVLDFTVLEGHRGEARQNQMVANGKSKLRWPNSKHNQSPSLAVDIAPYPIDWANQHSQFQYLAGVVMGIAHEMGIDLRWGGDWDRDGQLSDNTFNDLPHFEVVE